MTRDEVVAAIGSMVMSMDSGRKMVKRLTPHGPYKLLRLTKGGMAELDRDPNIYGTQFVRPSEIYLDEERSE